MPVSATINPKHEAAAKSLKLALALATGDGWQKFGAIIEARLSATERGGIAYAALLSLTPDVVDQILDAVAAFHGEDCAGYPEDAWHDPVDNAKLWVGRANKAEIDAYAVACVLAMSQERRAEFLRAFSRKEPAAS